MSSDTGKATLSLQGIFNSIAASYERKGPRFFSHFGKRLVDHMHFPHGARVLDVATGRGAVLFPATECVGPEGKIVGVDFSSGMISETAAEVVQAGIGNVLMHQMNAEQLEFPDDSFDTVLCGLSLWFFPNPNRALKEFFRVLRPGGHVGLTTFAKDSPIQQIYVPALRRHLPPPKDGEPAPPRFDSAEQLILALEQAGFGGIMVKTEELRFRL